MTFNKFVNNKRAARKKIISKRQLSKSFAKPKVQSLFGYYLNEFCTRGDCSCEVHFVFGTPKSICAVKCESLMCNDFIRKERINKSKDSYVSLDQSFDKTNTNHMVNVCEILWCVVTHHHFICKKNRRVITRIETKPKQ